MDNHKFCIFSCISCIIFLNYNSRCGFPSMRIAFSSGSLACWWTITEEIKVLAKYVDQASQPVLGQLSEHALQHLALQRLVILLARWERHPVRCPHLADHVVCFRLEVLVRADEVVLYRARLAEAMEGHPVLVVDLPRHVQQVADKLVKGDIIALHNGRPLVRAAIPFDNVHAELLHVGRNLAKLVEKSGCQPRHGLAHKHELVVGVESDVDLLLAVVAERLDVFLVVDLGDVLRPQRSLVHRHQHFLPVGAGHFRREAVEEAIAVIHQDLLKEELALVAREAVDRRVAIAARPLDQLLAIFLESLRAKMTNQSADEKNGG